MRGKRAYSVALAASCVLLMSCGTQTGVEIRAVGGSAQSNGGVTAAEVREAFRGVSYDFTEVESEQQLHELADLVIEGELVDVVTGRLQGTTDPEAPFADRDSAIGVRVTAVTKGAADVGDVVWIELPVPHETVEFLPEGLQVEASLIPAPEGTPDFPRSEEGSDIPEDARLWFQAHPQGLLFDVQVGERGEQIEVLTKQIHPW